MGGTNYMGATNFNSKNSSGGQTFGHTFYNKEDGSIVNYKLNIF